MAIFEGGAAIDTASRRLLFHPTSDIEALRAQYIGESLQHLDGPQAVLDVAVIKKNCKLMLDTADTLKINFRAHVKTTKTVEVTRLQVGDAPREVNLVVSTVAEIEFLLEYLLECKHEGRNVNVLYGIPPSSTSFGRLDQLRAILGTSNIGYMVDHPSQLHQLARFGRLPDSEPMPVFIKIDVGSHRAGVGPDTSTLDDILEALQEPDVRVRYRLQGFYSHNSKSYGVDSSEAALQFLGSELESVVAAAKKAMERGFQGGRLTLSIGATPSVSSAQKLLEKEASSPTVYRLRALIEKTQEEHDVELHAGVYPVLDLQQLATHARPRDDTRMSTMTTNDIGIRILAEVLSVYSAESRAGQSEALVGAGTLALGREPCKMYNGWGVIAPAPWRIERPEQIYEENDSAGWIVGRISQEHGILTWEGSQEHFRQLDVYEKILIWPNHACIAAAGFGWFTVVDSEVEHGTKVVDVWIKCRGW